jgi:aspartyl-tRNA(Asn)/glutamyl-tRNA(Gln) amidotransferase subunit B
MKLPAAAAVVLTGHPRVAAFFEEAATLHGDPIKVANFVQTEVLRDTVTRGLLADFPVTPRQVAELLKLVDSKRISGKQAKEVYAKIARPLPAVGDSSAWKERMPAEVVDELGMAQVTDTAAIEAVVRRVIEANAKQADAVRAGKTAVLGFLVGQVMKETKGSASPTVVNEVLKKLLGV